SYSMMCTCLQGLVHSDDEDKTLTLLHAPFYCVTSTALILSYLTLPSRPLYGAACISALVACQLMNGAKYADRVGLTALTICGLAYPIWYVWMHLIIRVGWLPEQRRVSQNARSSKFPVVLQQLSEWFCQLSSFPLP